MRAPPMRTVLPAATFFYAWRPADRAGAGATPLDTLSLPKGFHISMYAPGCPRCAGDHDGRRGTAFVGPGDAGKVYALTDSQYKGLAEKVDVIASSRAYARHTGRFDLLHIRMARAIS